MTNENKVVIGEVGEVGDILIVYKTRVFAGCVVLEYERAVPSQGMNHKEPDVYMPPEKARALAKFLLKAADEAEVVPF